MTKMIFHCMDYYVVKRPTMSQIVQCLQGLHVFNGILVWWKVFYRSGTVILLQ